MTNQSHGYRFSDLVDFCRRAYVRAGVPEAEAETTADLLVKADLRGVETHGVMRLPIYITRLEKGYVRKQASFRVLKDTGAVAFVTADGSMGHLTAKRAMETAVQKAETHGIGWVSVKDGGHFGVAGLFALTAAEQGMAGWLCSNSAPMMAPLGGKTRMIGNNPLAYAFPVEGRPPFVLDFSCSTVASGRLILARKKKEEIPIGWAVDKNGVPTTDPYEGYEGGGSLAPMGAHKGYGLALAHEIITAVLTGGKITRDIKSLYEDDRSGIQGTCHSFAALNPDAFIGKEAFRNAAAAYVLALKQSGAAEGAEEILIPGESSARIEAARRKSGIPLSAATVEGLSNLSDRLGIPMPPAIGETFLAADT